MPKRQDKTIQDYNTQEKQTGKWRNKEKILWEQPFVPEYKN